MGVPGPEEAERIGMITKVVEEGKHLDEAIEFATVIANNPRLAVLAGKESVNQQAETPLIPGLKLERRLFHKDINMVPEDLGFETKQQIALRLIHAIVATGLYSNR